MMKRTAIPIALLVAVGLAAGAPAPTDAAVSDAVIIGLNSIELKRSSEVTGDVVVNDPSTSATLAAGFDLKVDKVNEINGDLYAESMSLARNAVINGDLFVDDLFDAGAIISGGEFDYLPPIFQPLPAFRPATFDPAQPAPDVFVADGQTVVLDAGQYGIITIEPGGTLQLTGGGYDVAAVEEATTGNGQCAYPNCGAILFGGATDLRVAGRFKVGKRSYLGASPAGSCDATNGLGRSHVVYVGGANGDPADPNSLPAAAQVGRESVVCANFYVEAGTFRLDRDSLLKGSVIALNAKLDQGAEAILDSAFNFAPVADTQTVETGGVDPIDIVLTGSDADGDSLTFTIVSGPGAGSITSGPTQLTPTSAEVTYDANVEGNPDAFIFRVDDGKGGTDTAIVDINPSESCTTDADCAPGFVCNTVAGVCEPGALGAIIANDETVETAINTAVDLVLSAAAPDTIDDLVISVVSGPSNGSLAPLPPTPVDNGVDPVRSAETTYTPNTDFSGDDSVVFEACEAAAPSNCDSGTIDISVEVFTPPAPPNAPDINTSTGAGQSLLIDLGGGTGTPEPPDGRICQDDSDCAAGFICVDGACEPGQ